MKKSDLKPGMVVEYANSEQGGYHDYNVDLVERYMLYLNWDMDIRSRLAGAKPDSQPENWMKNIH